MAAGGAQGKKMIVLGGTGYVGSQVCAEAVKKGFTVTGVSRRGANPRADDELLSAVNWVSCDATDASALQSVVQDVDPDVVVHAVGLLFDVDSGLQLLNRVVSGSQSLPGAQSTYDAITRVTAENALAGVLAKAKRPMFGKGCTFAFVSAAEAGWPEVQFGDRVESVAPEWLVRYLEAKRSVEASLNRAAGPNFRPLIYRPSLIWSWKKLDVLPIIPVFNLASALGVPFVDKTVRVEDLACAIVEGCADTTVTGVQRFPEIESLAAQFRS